jgi:hypothetical protein
MLNSSPLLLFRNQEAIMSLLHNAGVYQSTNKTNDRKHHEYGFILALISLALALVVATAVFTPVAVGSGIDSEISFAGP